MNREYGTTIKHLLALCFSPLSLSSAYAQSDPSDDNSGIDTVVVVGRPSKGLDRVNRKNLAGAYDITTREQLEFAHPDDTLELFNKTPGVYVMRYNQGIVNTNLGIRGFAADGVTPHAKFLIDGIPANLHNGFPELDQMFPMAIDSIAAYKGTSDVRYGTYNIAGNFNVYSRSDEAVELQATYGSFDSFELQSYVGSRFNRLTQNLFAGYRQTSGYRSHNDLQKYAVSGRWFYETNDSGQLGFIVRFSGYDGDSPGYLTRDEARTNPRSSAPYANQDGGDKTIQSYSFHFEQGFLDDTLNLNAKAYLQDFERERWVRFSEEGSLQDRFDDQRHVGIISQLTWDATLNLRVSAGFDYEDQDNIEQRFGTIGQTRLRDSSNFSRNFDFEFRSYGGYINVEHQLFDRVRWNAGLRGDYLDGAFASLSRNENDEFIETERDIRDFDFILQPKFNVFVDVINNLTLFGHYGRSFQHPFGSALYTAADSTSDLDISINDGWEAGAKWSHQTADLRLSYWLQLASDEYASIDGTLQNVGETERHGIEVAASWTILESLSVWGNFSYTVSNINRSTDIETEGNRLRGVPDYTLSAGARYSFTPYLFVQTHIDGQGSYYVNELNAGETYGEYLIVSADAGFETETDRVSFQANNLFDQFYEYVFDFSSDGTATIHSPGDGINFNISYTRKFM